MNLSLSPQSFEMLLVTLLLLFIISLLSAREEEFQLQGGEQALWHHMHRESVYPKEVPVYPHRRDRLTQEPVSRGRIYLLGGFAPLARDARVPLMELKRVLQCAGGEPDLVGDRGTLEMIKMAPPSRDTVRLVSVWAETGCENWRQCHELLAKFDKRQEGYAEGSRQSRDGGKMTSPFQLRLLRVINGSLAYDWPFDNKKRFAGQQDFVPTNLFLLHAVLGKVRDLGDSVFFFGQEVSAVPFHFPFFSFSNSPSMRHADMPWPWRAHQAAEVALYREYVDDTTSSPASHKKNQTVLLAELANHSEVYNSPDEVAWRQRKSKAAFYGAMSSLRHVFFDIALANPQLFDVGWTGAVNSKPWNPLSDEAEFPYDDLRRHYERDRGFTTPGYLKTLLKSHQFEGHNVHLFASSRNAGPPPEPSTLYKYLVVLVGGSGFASADRLASMMLHSGAVLLLQKHEFEYHFSSRLKPWVHYVPLTYSAADVAEKVRWLQQNDRLARQLALNARTFALSHLRLEDLVCYAAAALSTMADVLDNSTSLEPFEPVLLPFDAAV